MDSGFKIQKTNFGVRIRILKITSVPIFRQNGQIWLFGPNLPKKKKLKLEIHRTNVDIQIYPKRKLRFEIQKTNVAIRISILEMPCVPSSDKTDNFDFLGPNLPQNGFWCQNFKNISLVLKSASLRYYVHQFSNKTNNFEFLGPNLPKK